VTLSDLNSGDSAIVLKVKGRGSFRKRIIEMGFIAGKEVKVIKSAPLFDPIEYNIMGYNVSLRRSEANLIEIALCDDYNSVCSPYEGTFGGETIKKGTRPIDKTINIALVGNPNCGKTTLFNNASGSAERVGNYSGVTIEAKEASFDHRGYRINITDLPGTYSITAYTPEELYVRSFIFDQIPDIVINVIDASNLERNLYLTTQLIDMDIKVIIALNMYDELLKKGDIFDFTSLARMIGVPIVPTIGSKGTGIIELFDRVIDVYEDRDPTVRHIHINYGNDIEQSINEIQKAIRLKDNCGLTDRISSRFLAIKMLEKDNDAKLKIDTCINSKIIHDTTCSEIEKIEKLNSNDSETIITNAKYGFIAGALKETIHPGLSSNRQSSDYIDTFLTHKIFGLPLFIAAMWLLFQCTFSLGHYPIDWIDSGVKLLSRIIQHNMPDGSLKDLFVDGILGGVGGVVVFLPNIMLLFFFISLMEDTGYMARAAFIMDRIMHKIGLHGKSFIPLIMGFGCNVPAIMATRTIESRNDRIVTILISPFISCSARLPVYVLFIGAFFPSHPGSMLFLIYSIGIALAAFSAILFKITLFKSRDIPFVMELPPYRMPTLRSATTHMWDKAVQYLKKMSGVILVSSIIIWALGYYPRSLKFSEDYDSQISVVSNNAEMLLAQKNISADVILSIKNSHDHMIKSIIMKKEAERQEKSYIGRIGHLFEPIIKPLGFDWRMGISIITGLAAKEIVVSSMGVMFNVESKADEGMSALSEKIRTQRVSNGPRKGDFLFTPLIAFSFIIFILIYFPCIATVAAMKKETGSFKWPVFSMIYSTCAAWFLSFLIYQVGSLFQ
jgi:ferrous iron transport protein B